MQGAHAVQVDLHVNFVVPLPPSGLQLRVIFIKELGIILLTWIPPRTLFDENNVNVNRQEPIYIVHAYMELNSSSSLLYRTEAASSSKNITLTDLNVSACNLSGVFFRVSAKFEGVGEGAMSHPEGFDRRDAEDVCMTGMQVTCFPFNIRTAILYSLNFGLVLIASHLATFSLIFNGLLVNNLPPGLTIFARMSHFQCKGGYVYI